MIAVMSGKWVTLYQDMLILERRHVGQLAIGVQGSFLRRFALARNGRTPGLALGAHFGLRCGWWALDGSRELTVWLLGTRLCWVWCGYDVDTRSVQQRRYPYRYGKRLDQQLKVRAAVRNSLVECFAPLGSSNRESDHSFFELKMINLLILRYIY